MGLRSRRRHEIQCRLKQSLVAGLAIQPKLYSNLCVPEVDLCRGALLCNAENTDAGITSAVTYIINQLVRILLKLPTQRKLQCVELQRQVKQTVVSISYRRLLKPKMS